MHHVAKVESVVGIDIGASSIKVVQLRAHGGRASLETYGTIALGPYAKVDIGETTNLGAPELVAALADVLREAGVTTKHPHFLCRHHQALFSYSIYLRLSKKISLRP